MNAHTETLDPLAVARAEYAAALQVAETALQGRLAALEISDPAARADVNSAAFRAATAPWYAAQRDAQEAFQVVRSSVLASL